MYHTWPAHGQADFIYGQRCDDGRVLPAIFLYCPKFTIELVTAVGGRIGPMDKGRHRALIKGAIDLLEAG